MLSDTLEGVDVTKIKEILESQGLSLRDFEGWLTTQQQPKTQAEVDSMLKLYGKLYGSSGNQNSTKHIESSGVTQNSNLITQKTMVSSDSDIDSEEEKPKEEQSKFDIPEKHEITTDNISTENKQVQEGRIGEFISTETGQEKNESALKVSKVRVSK